MAGLGVGASYSASSQRSSMRQPQYKPRIQDIEMARRLALGSILGMFTGNPYGFANLSFGGQAQATAPRDLGWQPTQTWAIERGIPIESKHQIGRTKEERRGALARAIAGG